MSVETLSPRSRDEWLSKRVATIGASELPALFGISPFMTPFQLYALKRGEYRPDFAEAKVTETSIALPPTERGNALEAVAFEMARRVRPDWKIVGNQIPKGKFFVDQKARMSATPDAFIRVKGSDSFGVIQVKTMPKSIFDSDWCVEGEPDTPLSVGVQTVADATLSGASFAYAAALVMGYGLELHLFEVPVHAGLMAKARALVAEFWRRVAENDPYPPDFGRDAAAIAAVHGEGNGVEADLSGNARIAELLERRDACRAIEAQGRAAAKDREPIDAELRHLMGNASSALAHGERILEIVTRKRAPQFVQASESTSLKVRPLRRRASRETEFSGSF